MIYHITTHSFWEKAIQTSFYLPEDFKKEGFIHCSSKDQIIRVANRFYRGQSDLVLLAIDPEKVNAEIVYENLERGEEFFPHIYGRLDVTAVEGLAVLTIDASGSFEFPKV
ncbi:MAG: DUF952 domain-containing protein [Anaerolinea sp.]|nr:DUF952 domain-containing protein [Anaerolinea sp.]